MNKGDDATPSLPEWEDIFHAIRQPTMVLDTSHKILTANRAASELVSLSLSEMTGRFCHEVFHRTDEPPNGCPMQKLLETCNLETNEMEVQALGGTYLVTCTPVMGKDQNISHIIHIATDVTDRKAIQRSLTETAEAASLYLDLLSHDMRNQLQGIILSTDLIESECGPIATGVTEAVEGIVYKAHSLITKVQATKDLPNSEIEDIDIIELLNRFTSYGFVPDNSVKIHITKNIDTAIARANEFIYNAIWNLIENAITHNDHSEKHIWITLDSNRDGFDLIIEDNSRGITDDKKLTLFDPNRRYGGVGLHQVQRITKKFNGRISISDRVEGDHSQGAKFVLWIPKGEAAEVCQND